MVVTPGSAGHRHRHVVREAEPIRCHALAMLVAMRWIRCHALAMLVAMRCHDPDMALPSLCPWPSPRLLWPSRPFPLSPDSFEAAWKEAIKLSEDSNQSFSGPGGQRYNAFNERPGIQNSVIQAWFQRVNKELPL